MATCPRLAQAGSDGAGRPRPSSWRPRRRRRERVAPLEAAGVTVVRARAGSRRRASAAARAGHRLAAGRRRWPAGRRAPGGGSGGPLLLGAVAALARRRRGAGGGGLPDHAARAMPAAGASPSGARSATTPCSCWTGPDVHRHHHRGGAGARARAATTAGSSSPSPLRIAASRWARASRWTAPASRCRRLGQADFTVPHHTNIARANRTSVLTRLAER